MDWGGGGVDVRDRGVDQRCMDGVNGNGKAVGLNKLLARGCIFLVIGHDGVIGGSGVADWMRGAGKGMPGVVEWITGVGDGMS